MRRVGNLFDAIAEPANLRLALAAARKRGLKTVALLGGTGGALAGKADHEIIIRGAAAARVQEAQQVILHLWLEMVERAFVR